jgi:type IV pilus assembly protein PilY1
MKLKRLCSAVFIGLSVFANSTFAEDIELYVTHNVDFKERPRVLIIFDTSGSMAFSSSTGDDCGFKNGRWVLCKDNRLDVAKNAIKDLVASNPDIDFGLMRFNPSTTEGGYVLAGIGSSRSSIISKIDSLDATGGTPLTETLWEAYLYLTGQRSEYSRDYQFSDRDTSIEGRRYYYISPFEADGASNARCDNSVNVLYMTDGDPSSGSDEGNDSSISSTYYSYFKSYPTRVYKSYLNSLAQILYGSSDQIVDLYPGTSDVKDFARVYTIGFGQGMSTGGKSLLEAAAKDGGGQYLHANTASELVEALKKQINRIREVNDSFSSPSVAVSSTDQTQSRDSLYFTMFYPDTHTRWRGNMKKLKVSNAKIIDQHGVSALNDEGLIKGEATTYWSKANSKDGGAVDAGGVAEVLANQTSRTVYSNYNGSTLLNLDYTTALNAYGSTTKLAEGFGVSSSNVAKVISWARGIDVNDEDRDSSTTDRRNDIFGDPLHSKPVTMDYGDDDIRVLVGTNSGFLHMFKDSGNTASESWAFIPGELLPVLGPNMDKKADTKLYGMDGPLTVHFEDQNKNGKVESGDSVLVIAGMRRGGNNYYAIDITNPDQPKLKWTIKGGTGDFQELGQSWSRPRVTYLKKTGTTPVVIFAAGYDTNKDNVIRSNDTKGRGIFIVEALTGKLVWSLTPANGFKGKYSMPADLSLLDSDYDGYTDRIYASDAGGGIWRVDIPGENPSDSKTPWTHFQFANLAGSTSAEDRKFFYRPMVARTIFSKVTNKTVNGEVTTTRRDTPYEAILIGSGSRTHPNETSTNDYLFVLRDENTLTQSFVSKIPAAITLSNLMDMTNDPFKKALSSYDDFIEVEKELGKFYGWKYKLGYGEKSLAAASVAGGIAYFTSFTPKDLNANQCSLSGGRGQLYAFHLHYGTQVYEQLKYETSYDVPDTPKLFFGCEGGSESKRCTNTVRMVGPAIKKVTNQDGTLKAGPQGGTPWAPIELVPSTEPVVENGKVKLYNDSVPIGFGLKTIQTFIYKKEDHDEKK